jgi:predicted ArsR family transcriptional regulator
MIISGLFGNETAEKVLLYLENSGEGYANGMARIFDKPVNQFQQQLERLEREGIVVSRKKGTVRIYQLNPRFAFIKELKALLKAALQILPDEITQKYFRERTRPRRAGKPLP